MKCIFSIAPVGNLEKSRECFSLRKHSPDAGSEAPDAVSERPVQTVPGPARVRHRTIGTGRWLERPVCGRFATLSAHGSGEHRTLRVRPVARVR